ncbi:hypothetical protein PFISCL1PPCAC_9642, partial [Pristionchus fissidentatus]
LLIPICADFLYRFIILPRSKHVTLGDSRIPLSSLFFLLQLFLRLFLPLLLFLRRFGLLSLSLFPTIVTMEEGYCISSLSQSDP